MSSEVETKCESGAASSEIPRSLASHRCLFEAAEPQSAKGNNFIKIAKLSPDGSHIAAAHDDTRFRIYPVPTADQGGLPNGSEAVVEPLRPRFEIEDGGPVLDLCFFPGFTVENLATCCFIVSTQGHPIHLRSAWNGDLCNTYRPFNNVDEVCHASSLCFSEDGGKIAAGFPNTIRFFDLQRPGRQTEDLVLSTRKGKGQKGIIGALANKGNIYAAGSYNRSICFYQEGGRGKPMGWFADQETGFEMGGVTQLAFHSDNLLLSGHRKDKFLRAWDLRMAGGKSDPDRSRALLHRFPRQALTHQRFVFGTKGDLLTTGDDSGTVLMYSLSQLGEVGRIENAHGRPCVCAQPHPTADLLLSASGSRCFPDHDVDSDADLPSPPNSSPSRSPQRKGDQSEVNGSLDTIGMKRASRPEHLSRKRGRRLDSDLDNSIRVWQLGWKGDEGA